METNQLTHIPVMLQEVLDCLPETQNGRCLDVTTGAAGHLSAILKKRPTWKADAWDRDPDAEARITQKLKSENLLDRVRFARKDFANAPDDDARYDFIMADIGVSSFQLDDLSRGMSLHSEQGLDFRMDPSSGVPFSEWLAGVEERKLAEIFYRYGEEPKAQNLAKKMKSWGGDAFVSAKIFGDTVSRALGYNVHESRRHPATRIFQALRIAINDELGQLESLIDWAPGRLNPGGRLLILSFHSLEDRIVKHRFQALARAGEGFTLPFAKPRSPTEAEIEFNSRSRSTKLRVIERSSLGK
ncbi:MAG: 16S rRNA (cytosine(1402)-N(4))-methyltransferase RsmH [Bdellovibrionota bacterium]